MTVTNTQLCFENLEKMVEGLEGSLNSPWGDTHLDWIQWNFWVPLCNEFGARWGKYGDDDGVVDVRERMAQFNRQYMTNLLVELDDPKVEDCLVNVVVIVGEYRITRPQYNKFIADLTEQGFPRAIESYPFDDRFGANIRAESQKLKRYLKKKYVSEMSDNHPGTIDEVDLPELSKV